MNTVRILSLIIGVVLLVVALVFIFGSKDNNFVRMAKILPESIGQFTFVDVSVIRTDEDLQLMWDSLQEDLLGEDVYGEDVSKITGLGMAGSEYDLMLYAGDFDLEQMTSVIEQRSLESLKYEGSTIWTDQYASSAAVIDDIVFLGSSEDIQLCIDVANGQGTSLYDNRDARDAMGRLPNGYILKVAVMGDEGSSYGLLYAGMAASKDDGNTSNTLLWKFEDSDAAQEYVSVIESQVPGGYDVTQDGQYITALGMAEMPSPEEGAYGSVYDDLQNAVIAYYSDNGGVFPTINATVNISGYDLQIVDVCALLTSEGGVLDAVPEGIAAVNGPNNDNCDAGCDGCLDTNHYIWAVNDYGLFSVCVGEGCEANGEDGYQGIWP